ncbi:hypothetical protein GCM10010433_08020 [Streptomyces pulveraceus]
MFQLRLQDVRAADQLKEYGLRHHDPRLQQVVGEQAFLPGPGEVDVAAVPVRPGRSIRVRGTWRRGRSVRSQWYASGEFLRAGFVGAGPPFNQAGWSQGGRGLHRAWRYGTPPEGNGNFARAQHVVSKMSPTKSGRGRRTFPDEARNRITDTFAAWRGAPGQASYEDVPGWCRSMATAETAAQNYDVLPSRHVGVPVAESAHALRDVPSA